MIFLGGMGRLKQKNFMWNVGPSWMGSIQAIVSGVSFVIVLAGTTAILTCTTKTLKLTLIFRPLGSFQHVGCLEGCFWLVVVG